jgi:hypothetical protein
MNSSDVFLLTLIGNGMKGWGTLGGRMREPVPEPSPVRRRRKVPGCLGYILTSLDGRRVWCGPGLQLLSESPGLGRLPVWPDRASAGRAAAALRKAINLHTKVAALRLP